MSFMDRLLGKKPARSPAKPKERHAMEKIAEFPCGNDGLAFVLFAYTSHMKIDGEDQLVRRYPLMLKCASLEKAEELVVSFNGDPRSVQPDGSVALATFRGAELSVELQKIEAMHDHLKKHFGIILPIVAVEQAIATDMRNYDVLEKYMRPPEDTGRTSRN